MLEWMAGGSLGDMLDNEALDLDWGDVLIKVFTFVPDAKSALKQS